MELCDRWGIPHSQFLGLGTGTWTRRDRAKALAYRDYQRSVCRDCGTREAEWDEAQGGDEDAYTASAHRCSGCQLIADKQADIPESEHGIKVALLPAAVHAALAAQRELTRKTPRRPRGDD